MAHNPADSSYDGRGSDEAGSDERRRPRPPRIAWLALILAAAMGAWFAAVWAVDFVIRANQAAG